MNNQDMALPQSSANPLNTTYKGVFSTRIGSNNTSKFGQYLDKMHQIKFLGIGAASGAVTPSVIDAALIKLASLEGRQEIYQVERTDRENEATTVAEALGEAVSRETQALYYNEGTRLDKASPAEIFRSVFLYRGGRQSVVETGEQASMVRAADSVLAAVSAMIIRRIEQMDPALFTRLDHIHPAEESAPTAAASLHAREAMRLLNATDIRKMLANLLQEGEVQVSDTAAGAYAKELIEEQLVLMLGEYLSQANILEGSAASKVQQGAYAVAEFGNKELSGQTVGDELANDAKHLEGALLESLILEHWKNLRIQTPDAPVQGLKQSYAEIAYEHELHAEDSQTYKAVLDALRNGFEDMMYNRVADEGVIYGLQAAKKNTTTIGEILQGSGSAAKSPITETEIGQAIGWVASRSGKAGAVERQQDLANQANLNACILNGYQSAEFAEPDQPATVFRKTDIWASWEPSEDRAAVWWEDGEVLADLTSPEQPLTVFRQEDIWGDWQGREVVSELYPERLPEAWGEIHSSESPSVYVREPEHWGEISGTVAPLYPEQPVEITGEVVSGESKFSRYDDENYVIAVLGCSDNRLQIRRRPDLKPDPKPEDPLFEWVCTEGYVCDDWLIVPLKDFNFEHPEMDGFYDPVTLKPHFPTGKEDANGDPYVLPPYSILNEPLSNGYVAGGQEPRAIDPCNLYSFIEYIVKIYDAYKGRFRASTPIDTMSRTMGLVFDQVQKLIQEWNESKGYEIDELWRIYRFIRWMALGITNRFYRLKLVYTYGDFSEEFDSFPFSDLISAEGASRKSIDGFGNVLEGHPILDSIQNRAEIKYEVPVKSISSTISFELGNHAPDRPDVFSEGGTILGEDFEGATFKINGDGWVPVQMQSGTGLGIEDPAKARTYRTSGFSVPANAHKARIKFSYQFETNLETALQLKSENGSAVWSSALNTSFSSADVELESGSYYFEVKVPQAESGTATQLTFTADRIQNKWLKAGEQTDWNVQNGMIYETANTAEIAMVVNPQWADDTSYAFEGEFMTSGGPTGLEDWIGFVFNYADGKNYYAVGAYGETSPGIQPGNASGVWKIDNGHAPPYENVPPTWKIQEGNFKWSFNVWYKMRVEVSTNTFKVFLARSGSPLQLVLTATDLQGWGGGTSGLAAYSNPYSTFRNFKYFGKPRLDVAIDNVQVTAGGFSQPVKKPKYLIDFYMEDEAKPRISNYSGEGKRVYSFPILSGKHKARWVFKKQGEQRSVTQDASFIDNIVIRGIVPKKVEVEEEIIGCGGHMAVKLLIENLLEYYRRHHQGCKGERNIWIIE